LTTSAS